MPILKNKTALITGAGRGIGMAIAVKFAREGADLILISRTADELSETANLCLAQKVNVFSATVDLADKKGIDNLFENLPDDFAKIDILVNNAAQYAGGRVEEFDYDVLDSMMRTNVAAPFYLCKKVFPIMKNLGGGSIVNISSYAGCFGVEKFPGFGAYTISKYGLWGLTEILALEGKNVNIRVNQISPSGVDTRMFREAVPPGVEPALTPSEVAEKVLYLASDNSVPLNGINLMLEGMPDKDAEE